MPLNLEQNLERCAILGAAGKMGRGIASLLLQEMALTEALQHGTIGEGNYVLVLIDKERPLLLELKKSLLEQMIKVAEKNIIALRRAFANNTQLVSNGDIIDYFIKGCSNIIQLATSLEEAKEARLVFEAVSEDINLKCSLLNRLDEMGQNGNKPFFFSNTSSIPISVLNEKAKLNGRIIGFHFYNPPTVQKLLEIIPMSGGNGELSDLACQLAKRLKKVVVQPHDVAGFIGNGHFMGEIIFACQLVPELVSSTQSEKNAIYVINKMTQQWLLRPMGIFQLMDYVGLDVVASVVKILNEYLTKPIGFPDLIFDMVKAGKKGGQNPDGSQREGFFQYNYHQLKAIYDRQADCYCPLDQQEWQLECDKLLGPLPAKEFSWKSLHGTVDCKAKIDAHMTWLAQTDSWGARLAKRYLSRSKAIAQQLVSDQVANDIGEVDTVLKNGFYHLYGPSEITIDKQ